MGKQIIDLTLEIKSNMIVQDAFQSSIYVQLVSHEDSKALGNGTAEDPFTSTWNYLGMVEHTGTHVDAFYHMDPNGLPIDQMPLDMFFGKAVCFDMRHIPERGKITIKDLEEAERKTGIKVDGHIVLFATGVHEKYFPSKDVLCKNPEITPEVVEWLSERNSRMHGVEGPSTDIMDTKLFPSHRMCRNLKVSHFEWLVNLDKLVGKGEFMFYGVPLKLKNGSGSPVRAFAVVDE
jgi:kynurenine formamidase